MRSKGQGHRGSTGFGKAFVAASDGQWGARMQEDLFDAVDTLVSQGLVDPAKVAILGGSYGGYAVLAGLAFTPDRFIRGVDIVGPSNLETLLASIPPYWEPMKALFHRAIGNPDTPGIAGGPLAASQGRGDHTSASYRSRRQ
ncbi:MAG: alpha/beta hydrolase family protein [Methylovirgula sp.]